MRIGPRSTYSSADTTPQVESYMKNAMTEPTADTRAIAPINPPEGTNSSRHSRARHPPNRINPQTSMVPSFAAVWASIAIMGQPPRLQ